MKTQTFQWMDKYMYTCAPWWSDFSVISGKYLYHKMTTFPSYLKRKETNEKKKKEAALPRLC